MTTSPPPDRATYEQGYWEKRFILYDLSKPTSQQAEAIRCARRRAEGGGLAMLELACGDGRGLYAYDAAGLFEDGDRVVALDLSQQALALTRHAVPKARPVCASALSLPFRDACFDFVFCSMLIEHVPDGPLLDEIRRIMKRDGILYLSTVIRRPYGPFRKRSPEGRLVLALNHLREYRSRREIADLAARHGFHSNRMSSFILKISILQRLIMLGLKLGWFRLSAQKRLTKLSPLLKRNLWLWALLVPIPGYYVFEGIFADQDAAPPSGPSH